VGGRLCEGYHQGGICVSIDEIEDRVMMNWPGKVGKGRAEEVVGKMKEATIEVASVGRAALVWGGERRGLQFKEASGREERH